MKTYLKKLPISNIPTFSLPNYFSLAKDTFFDIPWLNLQSIKWLGNRNLNSCLRPLFQKRKGIFYLHVSNYCRYLYINICILILLANSSETSIEKIRVRKNGLKEDFWARQLQKQRKTDKFNVCSHRKLESMISRHTGLPSEITNFIYFPWNGPQNSYFF